MKDPKQPEDRRALLHVRVQARARLRWIAGERRGRARRASMQGAFGVDVRNYDGLVVHLRHAHGSLAVQDGRLQRLEREGLRHAEHLERPGLGPRAGEAPGSRKSRANRGTSTLLARQRSSRCALGPYDIHLQNTPRTPTAQGTARLVFAESPFGVAVTADGRASYDVQLEAVRSAGAVRARPIQGVHRVGRHHGPQGVAPARAGDERELHRRPRRVQQVHARRSPPRRTRRSEAHGADVLSGISPSGWLQTFLSHPLFRGIAP